jgi:hypothetical protein
MDLSLLSNMLKRLIRWSIGLWPALEWRNRILMLHRIPGLIAFENDEVKRLSAQLGRIPSAKVACIVPTYKRPEQLIDAINSILDQEFRDYVIIIVDDGAGLPDLPKDERISALSLSKNSAVLGIVRNIGIRVSNSEYLAFLDDDNMWTPNHLKLAVEALDAGTDFIYTAVRRRTSDGAEFDVLSRPFDRRTLADGNNYIDANSIVLRRKGAALFSRLPRNKFTFPKEDWEFAYRNTRGAKVVHIEIPTVEYLVNSESYYTTWNI